MEDWKVDAGEIMDGAVETEAAPAEIEARPGEGAEGESFTLKHLDEVVSVDRGRVVELAQKGLDYDRVRSKLDSARDELAAQQRLGLIGHERSIARTSLAANRTRLQFVEQHFVATPTDMIDQTETPAKCLIGVSNRVIGANDELRLV